MTRPTRERWQALAKADLDVIHETIVKAHPGMLDQQNPAFRVWTESGYCEALDLLPNVDDHEAALSAVRHYTAGFNDGHLLYLAGLQPPDARTGRRQNSMRIDAGVLWVHAVNFFPQAAEAPALEGLLTQLRELQDVEAIVFDTRGNAGGDSGVGERIFEAATGGLEYDQNNIDRLPRLFSQWRVSSVSISTVREHAARARQLYGEHSEQTQLPTRLLGALEAARAAGRHWVEQAGGYRLDRIEIERRSGKLRRFTGPIALITDRGCASACLDFADLVRLVPRAIHVGETTSADSVYIDTARVALPSANSLVIPLKVWRNRLRGNNEPLVPDVTIESDIADDAIVRNVTLAALKRAHPAQAPIHP